MVCLVKSEYKKELKEYADILGSREAAYYILAANNGYTAEYTPDGKPSHLFSALLLQFGSYEEALIVKSTAYLPQFLEKHGDWIEDYQSEPSYMQVLQDVSDNKEDNPFKNVFPKYADWYFNTCRKLADNNITYRKITIEDIINTSRTTYIKDELNKFLSENPNATEAEIHEKKMKLRESWNSEKMSKLVTEQQLRLAEVFGLKKIVNEDGSWYYSTDEKSSTSNLKVYFVNSLREGEWKGGDGVVHKGVFVNKQGQDAAMNLIYISMMDGDLTTLTHELAHYYIRMFWDSEPVQTALKSLDYNGRQRSYNLEERLADELASRVTDKKLNNKSFWRKLSELASSLFNKNLSRLLRQHALDTLSAYFVLNLDLSDQKAERSLYRKTYKVLFQSEYVNEDLPQMLAETFDKINNGIEVRLKSLRSSVIKDYKKTESMLESEKFELERLDKTNKDDVLQAISQTIKLAHIELLNAISTIYDIKSRGVLVLDPKEFLKIKTDIIEYYRQVLLGNSINLLREHGGLSELEESQILSTEIDNIGTLITSLERVYDGILYEYCSYVVDKCADELVDVGNKEVWKVNAKMHLRNNIRHGLLMPLEAWIMPASSSYSPLIRLMEYLNTEIDLDTFLQTLKIGLRLFDKLKSAMKEGASGSSDYSFKDFFMNFVETDDEGKPTGYFISPRNIGLMKKRQREMELRLMEKYDVKREINERGKEVGFIFKDVNTEIQFLDEHDREMDRISNRRYKAEYYIERRKYLSKDTISAVDYISNQIRLLESRCLDTKTGLPNYSKLTKEETDKLKNLYKEKEQLSSFYKVEQDSTGQIISFAEKDPDSDEYRIAKELNEWLQIVSLHVKYEPDYDKFNEDREKVKQNMSKEALLWFDYFNSAKRIVLDSDNEREDFPRVFELKRRKNAILDLCKDKKGFYPAKLELLNDLAIEELRKIDEELYKIGGSREKSEVKFVKIDRTHRNGQTYYDYFRLMYPGSQFYDKFHFNKKVDTPNGEVVTGSAPMTMFYYFAPEDPDFVRRVPIGKYNSVDKLNSDWANEDFDNSYNESVLPKKELFSSRKWKKLHDGKHDAMLDFFESLLKTKQAADSIIPYVDTNKTTKLPQMTESSVLLFLRNGLFLNLWSKIKGFFRNDITINDRDTDYNEERMTRPDGSEVNTIPIRWISDLKDPSTVCTDLLGSVLSYYEMALSYLKKSQFAPLAETLLLQLHGGISSQTGERPSSSLYKRLKKYVDMYIYGRLHSGFGEGVMGKTLKLLAKGASNLNKWSHQKMMVHNWRTVLKNAVDSARAFFVEIFGGRYITYKDALFSFKECSKDFFYNPQTGYSFAQYRSLNGPRNISKVAAAMAYNKQEGSIYEMFSKQNLNWLRRWLSNNFTMGEYTLVDYSVKGWITTSVYHNIRLVNVPLENGDFKQMLVNQDQAEELFNKAGYSRKQGVKEWSDAKFTLWDCYTVDEYGGFLLLNQYIDLVRPLREDGTRSRKIETRVSGTLRELSAVINGILPSENRSGLSLNWAGTLLLLLRGWLITHLTDAFKSGSDFKTFNDPKQEGINQYQKLLQKLGLSDLGELEKDAIDGQFSFLKGTVDKGWLRGLWRAYKSQTQALFSLNKQSKLANDSFLKYQIRKFTAYMGCMAFLLAMTILTGKWVEKDPEGVLSNFSYSVNLASVPESVSMMSPMTLIDLVKNPTAAYSYIDDFDSSLQLLGDFGLMALNETGVIDDRLYDEIVKTGSYTNITKGQRTFLKASSIVAPWLGLNNIYKNTGWMITNPTEINFNYHGHRAYQRWNQRVFPNNFAAYKAKFKRGRPKKNNSDLSLDLDLSVDFGLDLDLSE